MVSDVVQVAWRAVGRPRPQSATEPGGWCARCGGFDTATSRARQVVPLSLTKVDGWERLIRDLLCQACTWAYQTPLLGSVPHLVVRNPQLLTPLTRAELGTLLTRPLGEGEALVVALQPGRQHLIASATWGGIATGDMVLPWTAADTDLLRLAHQLRTAGVTLPVLMRPTAPGPLKVRFGPDVWARFDRWRSCPTRMRLAFAIPGPHKMSIETGGAVRDLRTVPEAGWEETR